MINLFSEITIKNLKIKNRIVMPPMVPFGYLGENGFLTEEHIKHYEKRAQGGVGLIIVEANCVSKEGLVCNNQLRLWSDDYIDMLSKIPKSCHEYGTKVFVQLNHAGLKAVKNDSYGKIAPSDYKKILKDGSISSARALTISEIHKIQEDFISSAIRAKKAGFDGIELHGAHSYLISQFFSPIINKRTDVYGGNIVNRTRFAVEIIKEIRKSVGDNFIIGCRMGFNEPDLKSSIEIAKILENSGVDIIHVSSGMFSPFKGPHASELKVPKGFKYNAIVYGGTQIKKSVHIPVIVVNNIKTPDEANYLVKNNLADFTAIGRGLLSDYEWANKAAKNEPVNVCLNCSPCSWFKSQKSCPKNMA